MSTLQINPKLPEAPPPAEKRKTNLSEPNHNPKPLSLTDALTLTLTQTLLAEHLPLSGGFNKLSHPQEKTEAHLRKNLSILRIKLKHP